MRSIGDCAVYAFQLHLHCMAKTKPRWITIKCRVCNRDRAALERLTLTPDALPFVPRGRPPHQRASERPVRACTVQSVLAQNNFAIYGLPPCGNALQDLWLS